ncbi:ribosomal protection-like ABC-F family protein [Geomicrobium sp. JCM 19039]|uniref:ribosomal protection-like ABC-F family protein n=1 Tax=Geomicrobium sp. JCM 19039 TaxID=1460636 RepID=UPI00045F485D|nr:ABC-F family ATP-binding cassette domain-containing protein [Geomicrobium sp. JCM 19039]GAK13587.1 ABC transporter ATP-binding protein uup [Geomicrobium sp. JCM 19039]
MIILQCDRISKSFGVDSILQDIKMEIKSGERVALVGRNGSGKTTLLKIITGEMSYDSGEVIMPKSVSVGFLAQDTGMNSTRSIWDEMLTVYEAVIKLQHELRALEEQISDPKVFEDPERYEQTLKEYDDKQEAFQNKGGFRYEADIRSILSGLNFDHLHYSQKVQTLSGGQKTRLALAKLLLLKPDLLILDEPTNHLDIHTLSWLENYLNGYDGAVLVVSHDRYFLDRIVTKVYEIAHLQATVFTGNYTDYLIERDKRRELQQKAYDKQQEEIEQLETFVQKNLVRASTTKRAQSRRRKLERMDRIDAPLSDQKSASIAFDIEQKSGNDVISVRDLSFSYGDLPVLTGVNLAITRGESVAMIGPNGTGKSTLLKILGGRLEAENGNVLHGSKVTVGYYDQEQRDLNASKTVLQELWDEYPHVYERNIRTVLGRFLFSGEDVLKPVHSLSGGEKARLVLSKLMMKKANLLLFDEPTNHLDLDSKEVLEEALLDYPGTSVFISHDRYFLNRLSTRTLEFHEGSLIEYLGNYDYYLEKKEEEAERERLRLAELPDDPVVNADTPESSQTAKQDFMQGKEDKREARKRQRQIDTLEESIEQLEADTEQLQALILQPDVYEDFARAAKIQEDIEQNERKIEELLEEWQELQL